MRVTWVAARTATLRVMFAIALVVLLAGIALAQNPPAQQAPAQQQQQAAPTGVVFAGDAAIVLNYIKTDKAADFEAAMAKVKDGLQKSQSPERKQQAAGWKIFKSPDPSGVEGQTLYLFIIDPVVKGANYSVSAILAETNPNEAAAIFKQYADAYGKGQVRINLTNVLNMGQ